MSKQADTTREQPSTAILPRDRLLPSNRRLRHLKGIAIRNLTLTPIPKRARGKTIDDEALPFTLKSPNKAKALRENAELLHSRSSTDLRGDGSPNKVQKGKQPAKDGRPVIKKLRRRSTMEWVDRTPLERQKKLENVNKERLADVFFSLHVATESEPVYISEVATKAMNPNFQFFDLDPCGPTITRLDTVTVKVWAKSEVMGEFQYVIEWTAQLRQLTYLGKSLESLHHPLPPNCVVFHLSDGVYTSWVDVPGDYHKESPQAMQREASLTNALPTSSYDQLMQLATLDACIQDALATRDKIKQDIENVLKENQDKLLIIDRVPETQDHLKSVETAVAATEKELIQARKRKKQLQSLITERTAAMEKGRKIIALGTGDMLEGRRKLEEDRVKIQQLEEEITGQRRRVCEDLLRIFPIEPVPGKQLAFTIRGLYLPNSDFSSCNEDEVAAALGYVAQVVQRLQIYLTRIIPYPVTPRGSTSTIDDPISLTTGPRTYPLFVKGAVRYRFEYGVFLLNKDIEILANWLGLRLLDIRQTLPNLKYLLYVATAGKGELPARKMGGIRGLYGHIPGSRRESDLSDASNGSIDGRSTTKPVSVAKANGAASLAFRSKNPPVHATSRLRELV